MRHLRIDERLPWRPMLALMLTFGLACGSGASGGGDLGQTNTADAGAGQGGDQGSSGHGGQGGTGGSLATGGASSDAGVRCTIDSECSAAVPLTTPPGCAEPACDLVTGQCLVRARDADGDGHRARLCSSNDSAVVVALGDDCDDGDDSAYPGAWDGPEDPQDPIGRPDRCGDGVDQNCSGSDGDMTASDGATCNCKPGDQTTCGEDEAGIPISWPGGTPKPGSPCKYGVKTCAPQPPKGEVGWGPCLGAVAPAQEFCNGGLDDDCAGDGDGLASDKPSICGDADGDGYCIGQSCFPSATCDVPAGWSLQSVCAGKVEPSSCDHDSSRNPDIEEVCDGADNNCDGTIDEGVKVTFWFDDDDDGHAPTGVDQVRACTAPQSCPLEVPDCLHPTRWKQDLTPDDCDDKDPTAYPGNPDFPLCDGKDHNCDGTPNTGCNCTSGATDTCYKNDPMVCNHQVITCANGFWPACPSPLLASTYCHDEDGDGHCSTACQSACQSPGPGWKTGCPTDDCDDALNWVYPGASETCGDGIDANCDGQDSDGFIVGTPCTAGAPNTCCYRIGEYICNGTSGVKCSVTAGAPEGTFHSSACTNVPIASQYQWDWNCDGVVEPSATVQCPQAFHCNAQCNNSAAIFTDQCAYPGCGMMLKGWFCFYMAGFCSAGSTDPGPLGCR